MAEAALALLSVSAHVLGDVDGIRIVVEGEANRLDDDIASADRKAAASRLERAPQVLQRVEQKGDAIRRVEAEQPFVEHEEGQDPLAALDGGR